MIITCTLIITQFLVVAITILFWMAREVKNSQCVTNGCGKKVLGVLVVDGDETEIYCSTCKIKTIPKLTAADLVKPPKP